MFMLITIVLLVRHGMGYESRGQRSGSEDDESSLDYYQFLYKRLKEQAIDEIERRRSDVVPAPYSIPGPFEPLPGRSHNAKFWPLFPFSSQYSAGVDLDPSTARHIGGDINIAVPSWGMLDISGRFYNRIQDTTYKFGYHSAPVNMLGLKKDHFVLLMSDPSLHVNRARQPLMPIAKVPKSFTPMSCRAPLCNPYTHNFAFGYEEDIGGWNGIEGDIDVPVPISKNVAYRFPFSGNFYWHPDNITVTYGHNLNNIDPYFGLFNYQKYTPDFPEDIFRHRRKRHIAYVQKGILRSEGYRRPRSKSQRHSIISYVFYPGKRHHNLVMFRCMFDQQLPE